MGTPALYLPPALSSETITKLLADHDLPAPQSITPLQVCAQFHSIYLITFPVSAAPSLLPATSTDPGGQTISLILRLSGNHLPGVKTRNEVAVLRWVREKTKIPVPAVVRWSDTKDNAAGAEFQLLERMEGQSVDDMYASLSEETKLYLVDQLTDMIVELNSFEWHHAGGLQIDGKGEIVPGPAMEDTFWMVPEVEQYWDGETVESVNPMKVFDSHEGLVRGWLDVFIHSVKRHESLHWLKELVPRLEALIAKLPSLEALRKTRMVMAHRDMHFANVMAKPDGRITAILDWEFASVVPALRWDARRALLWNGVESEEANEEKYRLFGQFEKKLEERGIQKWWEGFGDDVHQVWKVIAFMRALVEVCPRGQRADKVKEWQKEVEGALERLEC